MRLERDSGPSKFSAALPLYVVFDHRADGRLRAISKHVEPGVATAAAKLLCDAGANAAVALIPKQFLS